MRPYSCLAVAGLALATGCASRWTVDRFEAPEANVAARRSFEWKPGELGTAAGVPASVRAATESRIRGVITGSLTDKGYAEVSSGGDMTVTYQVAGSQRFVLSEDQRVGAPSPTEVLTPSGPDLPPMSELPREQKVREGSVIVFVEDPSSGRLIWRGLIQTETRVGSREAGLRMIEDMARQIIAEFPARRTKS
jgi:hypothetical protein